MNATQHTDTQLRVRLAHPTGNANVRQVLQMLQAHNHLDAFYTSIAWSKDSWLNQCLPASITSQLKRRHFDVPHTAQKTNPWKELGRLVASQLNATAFTQNGRGIFSVDQVYRSLDRRVSRELTDATPHAVYCYEDSALHTFRKARDLGVARIYDLPIAYWSESRRLLEEEVERLPQWAATMPGILDSEKKLARKTEEAELADTIICPSEFVRKSLPESILKNTNCVVAPFGCASGSELSARQTPKEGPLRVLFVGSMTQRKGLSDIFEAMKLLNRSDIQLVVSGALNDSLDFYRSEYAAFFYEAPRPHSGVLELMSECDAFILPSLVEGRALVQLEALGVGLPLIITHNTGGDDLVQEDGRTGFFVPIRSPEAIAEKLNWFAENRDQIDAMKFACRQRASQIQWSEYQSSVYKAIIETIR